MRKGLSQLPKIRHLRGNITKCHGTNGLGQTFVKRAGVENDSINILFYLAYGLQCILSGLSSIFRGILHVGSQPNLANRHFACAYMSDRETCKSADLLTQCQSTGLVTANICDTSQILQGVEFSDNNMLLCHPPRPDCHGQCENSNE